MRKLTVIYCILKIGFTKLGRNVLMDEKNIAKHIVHYRNVFI